MFWFFIGACINFVVLFTLKVCPEQNADIRSNQLYFLFFMKNQTKFLFLCPIRCASCLKLPHSIEKAWFQLSTKTYQYLGLPGLLDCIIINLGPSRAGVIYKDLHTSYLMVGKNRIDGETPDYRAHKISHTKHYLFLCPSLAYVIPFWKYHTFILYFLLRSSLNRYIFESYENPVRERESPD